MIKGNEEKIEAFKLPFCRVKINSNGGAVGD